MTTSDRKILIIDDESLILSSLSTILSDNYEVITALEGVSGLTIFNQLHPSLVLVDANMPYMNGVEVLARIREIDRSVPVFMMTGRESVKYIELDYLWTKRCAELGISGYLIKPIPPAKLLRLIEKTIRPGQKLHE